jgi:hypothetical protein
VILLTARRHDGLWVGIMGAVWHILLQHRAEQPVALRNTVQCSAGLSYSGGLQKSVVQPTNFEH